MVPPLPPANPLPPLPPNTTQQQNLTLEGQRKINVIWEYTQAAIAMIVVATTMLAGVYMAFTKSPEQPPTIMSVAFGTVVGFYFSRTNHAAIGGVGPKASEYERYQGR